MNILYIYRNKSLGYSIKNVFNPIEEKMSNYANVDSIYLPEAGAKPWQLYRNIIYARKKIAAGNYDIVHITGAEHYLIPFLQKKKSKIVVTVHDLGFYINRKPSVSTKVLYLLWIKSLSKAAKIICISDKTKKEVESFIKIEPSKIYTINNPVSGIFKRKDKTFNKTCPTVLHISAKPHKNFNRSIEALSTMPCKLRIVGVIDNKIIENLEKFKIEYSAVSNLSNDEIVAEYENCDIVNFPSLHEGFGMPIIEGQAIGRVVVTSNIPPMNEIAGNGAVLVNPYSIESLIQGYREACNNSNKYIQNGFKNVERFSVHKISQQYLDIYNQIMNRL